jgi:hypothetical protein
MSSKSRCAKSVFNRKSTETAPLPSDKPSRRLEDIVENVQAIQSVTPLAWTRLISAKIGKLTMPLSAELDF